MRRLELGNGAAHPDGRLHRIELRDPLYLTPRSDSPANATLPGMVCYFDSNADLPVNTRWSGPGLYMLTQWQGGFEWMPAATVVGLEPDREENVDVTISQFHVGRMVRVNHGSTRTVTIGTGVVSAALPAGAVLGDAPGLRPRAVPGERRRRLEIDHRAPACSRRSRASTRSSRSGCAGIRPSMPTPAAPRSTPAHGIMPDGEFTYHARFHHTTAAGNQDPPTPYVLASAHVGKVLRVNNAAGLLCLRSTAVSARRAWKAAASA